MRWLKRRADAGVRDWLATLPWERYEMPQRLRDAPSMLTYDERAMLATLAREHPKLEGAIVDAGCFLGGSTVSLAQGLRERGDGRGAPVHTFDRFLLETETVRTYPTLVEGLEAGDSILPRFEQVLGDELELIAVHAGDVLEHRWEGGAIDVLFIDLAKTWEINDHVHRQWLPHLSAGTGVLVQQDFIHPGCPWLAVEMELLGDYFELIGSVGGISAVFRCTRSVPLDAVPADLRAALAPDEMLALFGRAAERFSGADRGMLECARAALMQMLGRHDDALAHLVEVEREYADAGPWIPAGIAKVRSTNPGLSPC